ncbi:MAG: hypothetical protein WDA47_03790 [Bacilli bacterium]
MMEQIMEARINYLQDEKSKLEETRELIAMAIQDVEEELENCIRLKAIYDRRINPDQVVDYEGIIAPALKSLRPVRSLPQDTSRKGIIRTVKVESRSSKLPLRKGKVDNAKLGQIIQQHFAGKGPFTSKELKAWILQEFSDIEIFWGSLNNLRNIVSTTECINSVGRGRYIIK